MRACGAQRPLPFLRRLSSAGEPLPPDVLEWTTSLGVPVHDQFGQTELGMPAGFPHHPALEIPVQASAMGRSLPGWSVTVLSMDSDDEAAPDQVGRLAIDVNNSPFHTFTGYGVERNQLADRLTQDGRYYLTGDLASLDGSGVLHFSSRDDDVILMAGYRIGPFEVESSLLGHPAVREVAVVAAPDEARGEVVHAFIVPSEDVTPDQDLVKTLQQWVKDTYAAHAYPRRITFVGTLPKTASGKIQRADLRHQARTEQ
jgi:acetyl-CoA synthetase